MKVIITLSIILLVYTANVKAEDIELAQPVETCEARADSTQSYFPEKGISSEQRIDWEIEQNHKEAKIFIVSSMVFLVAIILLTKDIHE